MIKMLEQKPKWKALCVIVFLSLAFHLWASNILNQSYASSQFPVPYYEAQLSFSDTKLKGWYDFLVKNGTMDVYVKTQHIDFVFILSVLLLHVSAILLISRAFKPNTRLRKFFVVASLLAALAPLFDALENGVSYIMMANVNSFPAWQAILYSSLAAAKFAMFSFAYLMIPVGVIAYLFTRFRHN